MKPFSLRKKAEAPLIEIDDELRGYASAVSAKILYNYRDYPSRTIYWKEWKTVKYIQIRLDETSSVYEQNIFYYSIYSCSYKIRMPILCFWNMYFDISKKNCREFGKLKSPINFRQFISLIEAEMQNPTT